MKLTRFEAWKQFDANITRDIDRAKAAHAKGRGIWTPKYYPNEQGFQRFLKDEGIELAENPPITGVQHDTE